eukprot:6743779-Pyramimonas_sp.AAC.4
MFNPLLVYSGLCWVSERHFWFSSTTIPPRQHSDALTDALKVSPTVVCLVCLFKGHGGRAWNGALLPPI